VSATRQEKRPLVLAVFLVVAGAIGFGAAWALTLDKFALLENPDAQLTCDVSVLVGCSKNLNSAAGALFGFPNPLIGIVGWTAVIAVGVSLLAGARFARWFWMLFNLGIVGALAFVIYLITQSVTTVHSLCPWCMVTWSVTIPVFWAVTLYSLKSGVVPLPDRGRRIAGTLYSWVPIITLVSYAVVAIVAQVQLDWLHTAFR